MIYLDSAATSFLKPDCVAEAVLYAMKHLGNCGRGFSGEAMEAARTVFETRQLISHLVDAGPPDRTAFTANATEALNTAILGTLHPEREMVHVITTEMEHNSVLRPLYHLREKGLRLTILPVDEKGNISMEDMEAAVREDTKAVVCTHASNFTGNLNPVHEIGRLAAKHHLEFILDAAQTAGVFPISMEKDNISILCAAGHKGLMGPQGTGVICVKQGITVEPLKTGGSGVLTFQEKHPAEMPGALEAGTLNSHGIAGLKAGVEWINRTGMASIREKEKQLARRFYEQIREIPGIKIYGDFSEETGMLRAPVVSLNIGEMDSGEVSFLLAERKGISTRSGGHCAPLMHRAFHTEEKGAVRFSFSCFNTEEEIDIAAEELRKIAAEQE